MEHIEPPVGLCLTCVYSRRVESGKGSVFWRCRRSETDGRFPKYPPLPVLGCIGYEKGSGVGGQGAGERKPGP